MTEHTVKDMDSQGENMSFRTIRHDLRTQVNHVIGYSELLLEEIEDSDRVDLIPDLQKIQAAGKQLLALINDRLNSLLEANKVDHESGSQGVSTMKPERMISSKPWSEKHSRGALIDHGSLLVVDDNEANRDVLSRHLQSQGYAVATADSGRQALVMIQGENFDLVLLDIIMPEVDGYAVLEYLKSDDSLRHIPVIMISALDEIDSVVRCIEMGAEDYLFKPFDPVLLRAKIGAHLEKKRLRDQEMLYLQHVAHLTGAAAAVHTGTFDPESLTHVSMRTDDLGELARVFQHMAREVYAREERLKQEVQELRIEIDQVKQARQVAEITETDYFQELQQKARHLKNRAEGSF